ncbi:uncharacterized protein LOC118079431 [Zootoca vivipara]|uniref:uncharacterized protein LOC118079431 n=1 Tax=Zootoca vivipara TaxID=8524 RepID=UPI00293BC5B3|nr:uncharacterized protein LOC118079431 [Zootoca vivipara]
MLGRDLLCKLRATIQCNKEGIYLHLPEESLLAFQGIVEEAKMGHQFPDLPLELELEMPPWLWGTESTSVGLLKSATPVRITYRTDVPFPCTKQYPLPKEAIDGLTPMIQDFLDQGILVHTASPCNTPVLPIKKPGGEGAPVRYRFVQDLRLVNQFVIPRHPVVGNPNSLLNAIPPDTTWYSAADLCSAFFSIPVAPESQFLFAFTWGPGQLTWTRLPQGYVESPAIFSAVLHQDLQDVNLPGGSTYLLYVDDILLCSTSEEACRLDTKYLLMELAHKGHKVSPKKLQFCKQEVKYLGHILGVGTRSLATDRIEAVTKIPLPQTKRQLRGFLGMAGFCRSWIAGYAELTKPLTAMTRQDHPDKLQWNEEAYASFERIKRELRSAPALGLPDYRIPFNLYVHEQMGVASGVLTQPFRDRERPVAYYSLQLDNTAKGTVNCLRAIAATAALLEKAQETVLGHEITIHVPHAVSILLTMKGSHHFSNSRLNRYEALLLTPSNVTIKRVTSLNPATLLPLPDDGTPHHDCAQIVRQAEKPREDLDHLPLPNPDLILYTDGSSKIVDGERKSGYAVVTDFEIIEANPISPQYSAQAAELVALIRACEISEGKRATIYTDSKYCFGLVHTTGQIWLQRGFLTAAGSQISHAALVERLLNAIHLPEAIAVVHCKAHTRGRDPISKGNSRADRAAQMAALQPPSEEMDFQCIQLPADLNLKDIYQAITDEELAKWISIGASEIDGIWTLPDGRIVLPKAWTPKFARTLHQQTHWGKGKITDFIQRPNTRELDMEPTLHLFILLLFAPPTMPLSDQCSGLQTDYRFLDYHTADLGGNQNPDRVGDFNFCLPESRTLLRHSLVPRLSGTQYWELFIRDRNYQRIGSANLTMEQQYYRLHCTNGSYFLYGQRDILRYPNWTEMEKGGAQPVYTDNHHPSERLIFGFQCLLLTPKPEKPQLQGVCLRRFCCLWNLGYTQGWKGGEYLEGWYHPVGSSNNSPVWDHDGPQRCGGIAKNTTLLSTSDPLHPIGTAPRQLGEYSTLEEPDLLSSWGKNSYLQLLSQVAKEAPPQDCWICAHAPSHMRQGLPLVPVPVTLEQFRSGDMTSWNLTAMNLTHQYLYLTGPTKGPLCRLFAGGGAHIGTSTCTTNLELHASGQVTISSHLGSHIYPNLSMAWVAVIGRPSKNSTYNPNPLLLRPFASGRMESYLSGLFWVCGHRAYSWVSPHMSGSCFIGYIVPGIRVTYNLPAGRQRNRRGQKSLSDLSDVAANGETWGRALFPAYGAGSNHVDILKLTDVLLKFMQEAEQITDSLTTELSQGSFVTSCLCISGTSTNTHLPGDFNAWAIE